MLIDGPTHQAVIMLGESFVPFGNEAVLAVGASVCRCRAPNNLAPNSGGRDDQIQAPACPWADGGRGNPVPIYPPGVFYALVGKAPVAPFLLARI